METELEAKFLDIDSHEIREKLLRHGATMIYPERLMRRRNFDFPDRRLYKIGGWVRVRDEGDRVTLAYKRTVNDGLDGTKELEISVDDFDKITGFLLELGLEQKSYQETKREKWDLDGVEVTIDSWPWVPSFAEIEGKSESALRDAAEKLGLDWGSAMHGGVAPVYCRYYEVTADAINGWPELTFDSKPIWTSVIKNNFL